MLRPLLEESQPGTPCVQPWAGLSHQKSCSQRPYLEWNVLSLISTHGLLECFFQLLTFMPETPRPSTTTTT